mgnify:CR=1 FL=1
MRITTSVVMFYVWLTAGASLLEITGISESMGLSTEFSVGSQIQQSVDALGSISGGGLGVESLIGVFTLVTSSIQVFASALTAGPRLMIAMGIPVEIAVFLHAPAALLAGRLGIYALSGRDI